MNLLITEKFRTAETGKVRFIENEIALNLPGVRRQTEPVKHSGRQSHNLIGKEHSEKQPFIRSIV